MTITTHTIYEYLTNKFPSISKYFKNGMIERHNEKSIGVLKAPSTRAIPNVCIGGIECTAIRMLPINILVHWTKNQHECDIQANRIFDEMLKEYPNFTVGDVNIAYFELLDNCPMSAGKDDHGICECIIRVNVYYYI